MLACEGFAPNINIYPLHVVKSRNINSILSSSPDDNNNDDNDSNDDTGSNNDNLQETISGGHSTIMAMARRMLVWDDQDYQLGRVLNDSSQAQTRNLQQTSSLMINKGSPATDNNSVAVTATTIANSINKSKVLPRWHPHEGIADSNPNFRTKSPLMNNRGYAEVIMRNARKNNQPGLWRHSYRTYVNMRDIELQQIQMQLGLDNNAEERDKNVAPVRPSKLKIRRENRHFQGALVACAKLGLWREALFIYQEMQQLQLQQQQKQPSNEKETLKRSRPSSPTKVIKKGRRKRITIEKSMVPTTTIKKRRRKSIIIDKYMVLSIIRACIRGMKYRVQHDAPLSSAREPLDAMGEIIRAKEKHTESQLAPSTVQINALASAYQYLGLYDEAIELFDYLEDPISIKQEKELEKQKKLYRKKSHVAADFLTEGNVLLDETAAKETSKDEAPVEYKDEGSYNILIKNSVTQGDWSCAIENLKKMTEAGYYPKSKSLNVWSETATKRERRRKKPTWIKQREQILVKSVGVNGGGK